MPEIMIDLETLDTRSTAVIVSAGIVSFDSQRVLTRDLVLLSLDEQVYKYGRTISPETVSWWMQQGEKARLRSFNPSDPRHDVSGGLERIAHIFADYDGEWPNVWANSPSFDLAILGSLFDSANIGRPWDHSQERDVRTMRKEAGIDPMWRPYPPIQGVAHDPVYDCEWQIAVVREARSRFQG